MKIVKKTSRKPNYSKDLKYGKVGERDFEKIISKKIEKDGGKLFDVRDEEEYQLCDIDYVIDRLGKKELPSIDIVLKDKRYLKVEAKTDGVAVCSGNLPFESISHGRRGWCEVTECDYVYFALTEKDSDNIIKRAWVNMKNWKSYCSSSLYKRKVSYIENEDIVDLLCRISDLEKNGILKWVGK